MGTPTAKSIVLVPFSFSDLSQTKLRPALVLAETDRGDCILCQITSNPYGDSRAIALTNNQLAAGSLHKISYARPSKLFTANHNLMQKEIGSLTADAFKQVIEGVINILRSSTTQ
ncbi:MAG: type II toxin-antitoxin system PemK/MazF family toxin [Gemmatimonadetes bacterium]|nr:type II toxin-antitoxin system PemK/MazF family toxin [Gemmatimonadota bacterium]MXY82678.1 type II toxin-antitoxin system PemK/MazF family toxin [Gemmatimonadota bacterium]MYB67934.1 type II toxin-antitoxin system PemK/MazF family toxin [Gemmatimonadota bacterium]